MFNIQAFLYQLLATFTTAFKADYDLVKIDVEGFINSKRDRLSVIAESAIKGTISVDELKEILKNELTIVEIEVLSLEVVTKEIVQEATNAIINKAVELLASFIPQTN